MAVCKTCGIKYSKWITPVSARGICAACFETELSKERAPGDGRQENVLMPTTAELTEAEKPIVPIRWRSFVPRTRSKIVFALVMGCYSVSVGSFTSAWAYVAHVRSPPRSFYRYLHGGPNDVMALLVFAPLFESLILIGVFELVRRARAPTVVQVLVAASFISALHVQPWWPHAAIVLPSFCIQGGSYLYWRDRTNWKDAYWVVVSIHALNNLIPALHTVGYALRHA